MSVTNTLNVDSLERLVPAAAEQDATTGSGTLALHLARYEFAAKHVVGPRLLDIACGVGYGSQLLARQVAAVQSVTGVDLSSEAIAYAQSHYQEPNIEFLTGDALTFSADHRFDTVVSLETIEHLPQPEAFLDHVRNNLVRSGGLFIGSVPTTPSVDANPHHLHDFSPRSFRKLFTSRGFREVAHFAQVQPFSPFLAVNRSEGRARDLRKNLAAYYLRHPLALSKRLWTTLRHGFVNHYLTVVCQAP